MTGFEITIALCGDLDARAEAAFWDAFVAEAIEAAGLAYGGGARGFVTRADGGDAADGDRRHLATWLRARRDVERFDVGPLEDARPLPP